MRKTLLKVLTLILALCSALCVFTACGGGNNSGNNNNADPQIVAVYNLYVADAKTNGKTPLSYEEWLATIKGEKGDKGAGVQSVEFDKDGKLVIILTDGTVLPAIEMPKVADSIVESLQYQKIPGKEEYAVIGLGNVSDLDIVIPSTYRGLPVTKITSCSGENDARIEVTSIVIPNSVTIIGDYAFYDCRSLTSIVIPNSVTSVGSEVFYWCNSLTIYCEAESQPKGWSSDWNASDCPVVWDCKNNEVADDGYTYTTVGGIRYKMKDGTAMLTGLSTGITAVNIPASINYKGNAYSVTIIGDSAFYDCDSLTSVAMGNSVTSIGYRAFFSCDLLTSVVVGNSVTSIDAEAFANCKTLETIVIPKSVTSIGYDAFSWCSSLKIYCEAESQPDGWHSNWDCNHPYEMTKHSVVWNYKGENA